MLTLRIIAGVCLVVAIIAFIYRKIEFSNVDEDDRDSLKKNSFIIRFFGILAVLFLFFSCFQVVPVGKIAIKVKLGMVYSVEKRGVIFVSPLTRIVFMDNQIQSFTVSSSDKSKGFINLRIMTKDSLIEDFEATIWIRLTSATRVYEDWGSKYTSRMVIPIISTSIKDVMSQMKREDFYFSKSKVQIKITELLNKEFKDKGIVVVRVLL
ncbi:MAG: SPFH domain-containing protein [Patescibacteria group bacterium]|nr:SPFH domain-containing protein [Patescibacteria group bacterium]MDD5164425.1 SPFH domain-containing protein [Patescibacteria group bacterium]MDD5534598.1 SPFH domain-containing protein [Patescibacteria group bacterium]